MPGLLEIPAYGLAMVVLLKYGRRVPYSCALISSGICLLSVGLVPRGNRAVDKREREKEISMLKGKGKKEKKKGQREKKEE